MPVVIQGGFEQLVIQHKEHNVVVLVANNNFVITSDNKLLTDIKQPKLIRLHVRPFIMWYVYICTMCNYIKFKSINLIIYIINWSVFNLCFWCDNLLF